MNISGLKPLCSISLYEEKEFKIDKKQAIKGLVLHIINERLLLLIIHLKNRYY